MAALWTTDKEEEFVSMVEGKPELFDNTEMNFTNRTVKMNSWLELAKHFQISEKELRKKWDSLRTQYSRYTKMMYGSDARFFTPRQQWIMQRLKFLDPHIKRRSNYCTDLDYEVTVVENGCEDLSPTQVDVEIEADSMNKLEMNLDTSKLSKQLSKRAFQEDDSDLERSSGAKKPSSDTPSSQTFPKNISKRRCDEDDEDEESDSASLRRIVCSTMEEKKDECWDGFSLYVSSCLRSLNSSENRMRAQDDMCAVLQRHMERDGEDVEERAGDKGETCRRTCSTCSNSTTSRAGDGGETAVKQATPTTDDQDDLEPFLKSMSIIMKRLPEGERSEVKFRIHELVHKAQMKHLNEQRSELRNIENSSAL
ncbi:uncharacterized protein wu:fb74b10 isoform X1 [Silurus meridionalis]|uniref:MADF domain-containing protein n=2 Tax=Silurus meridionalis TaxID=175797 RepID=A0A8T0AR42_SILME|nr:uncharacterized protein wu:fb74b10 isoform X1 [Silurus meridionalis]KAF7694825.1 hypothetical protein HF521_006548 [Silurus meridionalis]KAI5094623.1 hypothetical protein C0J45_14698 [Silurus meridionalis]